ncbi:MAG TPA: hypothetical protein V6D11_15055 [Waterburya sp.]
MWQRWGRFNGIQGQAIASSWRNIARFLPETLPLQPANLSWAVYPLTTVAANPV